MRGRIEVNSFFSQTRSHPVGVLREEGGPFSGSQCRRGALFPLVSQAQLCPVSEEPPPRNRAVCPCVVGRSQSCSVSSELLLHLTVAAACPSEGRLVGWGVWFSPGRPQKPNIMRAIWTCILKPGSSPLPHSHPCFVFSPCHQILR